MDAAEITFRLLSRPITAERKQKCLGACQRHRIPIEAVLAGLTEDQRKQWDNA